VSISPLKGRPLTYTVLINGFFDVPFAVVASARYAWSAAGTETKPWVATVGQRLTVCRLKLQFVHFIGQFGARAHTS